MSLSRLLSLRLRLVINTVERRRWCSSVNDKGEISQSLKKSEVVEQQKAMDVSEKKHMTENEEAFPRETHVQKEVGPWNSLLAILQITKKKIFGNLMEQKSSSTHALTSTSDLKDSDNVVSADSHDSGSMNNLKITIHSEKTSKTNMEENVDSETSLSSYADKSIAVEVVNMKNASNSVVTEELLNISSKECEESADCRENGMSSGPSSICGKTNSNGDVQMINNFHHSELVKKEREQLLADNVSSSVQISSGKEILSKSEEACITEHQMQMEIPRTSDRGSANKSGLTASEYQEEEIISSGEEIQLHHPTKEISIPPSLSNTKMNKISSVSYNSSHMEAVHRAIDQIVNPKSEKSVPKEFDHLHETSQNTSGQSGGIKSLLECIRVLPPQDPSVFIPEDIVVDGSVDRYRERSASNSIQSQTDKQSVDWKKIKTSSQGVIGKKGGLSNKVLEDLNPGDERAEIRNTAPHDFFKSIEAKEITSMREKGDLNKNEDASLSEMLSDENKMTIKFVNVKATEKDVYNTFKSFGAITKVVLPSVNSTKYKVADIYFESEEGRQKALKSSDVDIMNVVVVDATSPPKGRKTMCIPDIIGYSEVPTSLVKHPSRTVMIKKLKQNMSFHDIEEALAFCRSNITGIFFGSSSSVAYVEFATVEGKETAIEKHSLVILGETLPILRIDAPRTTIVRISNISRLTINKVVSFCKELGQTRHFFTRGDGILDVHFKIAEWPRMLEIINRLNGIEVDGQQLVAKPAPVYPPDILNVLWSRPEGRKHLKTTFNSMLLKVGGDAVGLAELVDKFYADVQET